MITGEGGTGKSEVLHVLHQTIARLAHEQAVITGAYTGSAAFLVSGQTLHSLFALPVSRVKGQPAQFVRLYGEKLADLQRFLGVGTRSARQYLFIDEVSMVSNELLNWLSMRLQQCFQNTLPFGGMNVVCFGDFYQLAPISEYSKRSVYVFDDLVGGGSASRPSSSRSALQGCSSRSCCQSGAPLSYGLVGSFVSSV